MAENKRVTILLDKPNHLFEKWLSEWKAEAKREGSKRERTFSYALSNLKKYKIPLASGAECKILKGFGDKLCRMLDAKLKEFNLKNGMNIITEVPEKKTKSLKKVTSENYVPKYRSGGYAILMALHSAVLNDDKSSSLTKEEIIVLGKQYSSTSFTKPDPGSFYTAWSSLKTLLEKGLVSKKGKPLTYYLTDKGHSVAKIFSENNEIINKEHNIQNKSESASPPNDIYLQTQNQHKYIVEISSDDEICDQQFLKGDNNADKLNDCEMIQEKLVPVTFNCKEKIDTSKCIKKHKSSTSVHSAQSSSHEDFFIFEPNNFDVILYVDTQETSGSNVDVQDDPLLCHLQNRGVHYEVKHLNIGDYVWICRHRQSKKELVLPYIIERKRLDDFASSIKDGRYYEQKFRLKRCGLQEITYLIEKINKHVGLPLSTLHQAAANTAIQDGFNVKFTANIGDTSKYLAKFSTLLFANYKDKTLLSCSKDNLSKINVTDDMVSLMTFKEFNTASSKHKPLKVSDLFIKMLLQIHGMSVEKACAITEKYPTPTLLKNEYDLQTESQGEKCLAKLTFGKYNKMIGPALSKIVYDLFTKECF